MFLVCNRSDTDLNLPPLLTYNGIFVERCIRCQLDLIPWDRFANARPRPALPALPVHPLLLRLFVVLRANDAYKSRDGIFAKKRGRSFEMSLDEKT